ncbi:MAG: hypothetical protein JWP49_825 [Phenylobacterium sp.]|nr:hypothetical protein [Phenylobacterium sp.]
MLALLLATQIITVAPPPVRFVRRNILEGIPAACQLGVTAVDATPQPNWDPKLRRLGDLPKAHLEIAINRTVGGCPAPVIVRYDVQGDGRAAKGAGGD